MTFHQSPEFKDAILAASKALQIRPVLVEKDYWVTFILHELSLSTYAEMVVFKGGTSLSKAYDCIKRFSEDIDLAIIPQEELSGNQIKNLLSKIDHAIADKLDYKGGEKKGRNRTSIYNYPKVLAEQDFGAVRDQIKLELNAFTNPVPHAQLPISSYLYTFLSGRDNIELTREYDLQPFSLNVLSLERTFFEKTLSLNRLSYYGIQTLKEKIRHFYDLYQLYHNTRLKETIFSKENFNVLSLVKKDDESIRTFHGEWMDRPLAKSPLFSSLEDIWKDLISTYRQELSNIIWSGDLPAPTEILSVMQMIRKFINEYDDSSNRLDPTAG